MDWQRSSNHQFNYTVTQRWISWINTSPFISPVTWLELTYCQSSYWFCNLSADRSLKLLCVTSILVMVFHFSHALAIHRWLNSIGPVVMLQKSRKFPCFWIQSCKIAFLHIILMQSNTLIYIHYFCLLSLPTCLSLSAACQTYKFIHTVGNKCNIF